MTYGFVTASYWWSDKIARLRHRIQRVKHVVVPKRHSALGRRESGHDGSRSHSSAQETARHQVFPVVSMQAVPQLQYYCNSSENFGWK